MPSDQAESRFLNPADLPRLPGFSQVVDAVGSRTVYVSGQLALDPEGRLVGVGNFEAQARQVFRNIHRALAAAGVGFGDVVKLGMFVTDVSHLATLRIVRDEFVDTSRPPASTLVQVAALFRPEFLVEVDAIALGRADSG